MRISQEEIEATNSGAHRPRAMARVAVALAMVAAASGEPACTSRADGGCSRHGDCVGGSSCACDSGYEGDMCDIWRAPPRPELKGVDWANCTHGYIAGNKSALVQHCDMRRHALPIGVSSDARWRLVVQRLRGQGAVRVTHCPAQQE